MDQCLSAQESKFLNKVLKVDTTIPETNAKIIEFNAGAISGKLSYGKQAALLYEQEREKEIPVKKTPKNILDRTCKDCGQVFQLKINRKAESSCPDCVEKRHKDSWKKKYESLNKICVVCNTEFQGRKSSPACSSKCMDIFRKIRSAEKAAAKKRELAANKRDTLCKVCGKAFQGSFKAVVCSDECKQIRKTELYIARKERTPSRKKIVSKNCIVCQKRFKTSSRAICCSVECSKARKKFLCETRDYNKKNGNSLNVDRKPMHYELEVKPCIICEKLFEGRKSANTCSDFCKRLRNNQVHAEWDKKNVQPTSITRSCVTCNRIFESRNGASACSKECQKMENYRKNREYRKNAKAIKKLEASKNT